MFIARKASALVEKRRKTNVYPVKVTHHPRIEINIFHQMGYQKISKAEGIHSYSFASGDVFPDS